MWKQILRPAREVKLTEADRVLTGKHRPPIACRYTNWQLVLDEVRLPSYESLRWFIRIEIALRSASVESSAISFLECAGRAKRRRRFGFPSDEPVCRLLRHSRQADVDPKPRRRFALPGAAPTFLFFSAGKILSWIYRLVVYAHFIMQVRPSRAAGRTNQTDSLPSRYRLANLNVDFRKVTVSG